MRSSLFPPHTRSPPHILLSLFSPTFPLLSAAPPPSLFSVLPRVTNTPQHSIKQQSGAHPSIVMHWLRDIQYCTVLQCLCPQAGSVQDQSAPAHTHSHSHTHTHIPSAHAFWLSKSMPCRAPGCSQICTASIHLRFYVDIAITWLVGHRPVGHRQLACRAQAAGAVGQALCQRCQSAQNWHFARQNRQGMCSGSCIIYAGMHRLHAAIA